MQKRTAILGLWCTAVMGAFWPWLGKSIQQFVLREHHSQAILVPLCVIYLIWSRKTETFSSVSWAWRPAAWLALASLAIFIIDEASPLLPGSQSRTVIAVICMLLLVVTGFLASYGVSATRRALVPLCLLIFVLPIPAIFVDAIVGFLQTQSAKLTALLFSALGVPVYRDGVLLSVPGVTIEVAKECSGINSSIALLITMLLVGYETLQSTWRRVVFVLVSIPLSLAKNAIRIATLTLLALHVDPGFLNGRLHHEGGVVFYLLSLALMYPIWKLLRRGETKQDEVKFRAASPAFS